MAENQFGHRKLETGSQLADYFRGLMLWKHQNDCDRIRGPTGVATEVVGMEERRARLRAAAAGWRRGDHSARKKRRCG